MRRLYTAQRREGADPATTLLIADRWRWGAFAFPLLWALWSRHWLAAMALLAWSAGMGALAAEGYGAAATLADLGLRLIVGFEGAGLARLDRALRGWREEGAVLAWDDEDAEVRWFGRRDATSAPAPAAPPQIGGPVVAGPWGPRGDAPA